MLPDPSRDFRVARASARPPSYVRRETAKRNRFGDDSADELGGRDQVIVGDVGDRYNAIANLSLHTRDRTG